MKKQVFALAFAGIIVCAGSASACRDFLKLTGYGWTEPGAKWNTVYNFTTGSLTADLPPQGHVSGKFEAACTDAVVAINYGPLTNGQIGICYFKRKDRAVDGRYMSNQGIITFDGELSK